nr:hypothetical protein [Tanacetum cinerariifolium]
MLASPRVLSQDQAPVFVAFLSGSFVMSLEESDNLDIADVDPINPALEVLAEKEKKHKKAKAKAAEKAGAPERVAKVVGKRRAREEGTYRPKKKKIHHDSLTIELNVNHVSSPTPINQSKPLHALANEAHVYEDVSTRRLDALRNQADEQSLLRSNVNEEMSDRLENVGDGNGDGDGGFVNEGHSDNTSRLFGDMMADLFTPADNEFFNDRVPDGSAIKHHESCEDTKAHYKGCKKELAKLQSAYDENMSAYDQLSKDYDGALIREKRLQEMVEELEEEKKEMEEVSTKKLDWIKQLEEEVKKSEEDIHQLRLDRERYVIECGNGEMVRCKIINEYLLTFGHRLHQSAEYRQSLGEV